MKSRSESLEWRRKRKLTFGVYLFQYFLNGFERSSNTANLWVYVSTLMNIDHKTTYYGLINAAIYIPPILFGTLVGRRTDKTRHVRQWMILANFISMGGSILYVIPNSPWFAITGKFMHGFTLILRPLMVGEVVRSYPKKTGNKMLPLLATMSCLGFALGPCVTAIFIHVDFYVGNIHITYGNVSGIVVLGITVILQFCVLFFTTDLSKEYDLKKVEMELEMDDMLPSEDAPKETEVKATEELTSFEVLRMAFKNKDYILIVALTFYSACLNVQIFRLLPLVIINELHLDYLVVNVSYFAHSIFGFVMMSCIVKASYGPKGVFISGVISTTMVVFIAVCFAFIKVKINGFIMGIPLLVILLIALNIFEIGEQIFLLIILANLTKSTNQCYLESIRFMIKQIGCVVGALTSAYAVFNLEYYSVFLTITGIFFLVAILLRKRSLSNPIPIL